MYRLRSRTACAPPTMANPWPPASLVSLLATNTRHDLFTLGILRRFPARQTIIRQGGTDDHALLLLSGSVKITCIDESGCEALLAIRVGGDLIGEMAPLQRKPRSATVIACSEVYARILSRAMFTNFLETHADAAIEVAKMVMSRLRWANQRRLDFVACPASVRVGRVLVELALIYGWSGVQGSEISVPMTQPELASLAGVALTMVEKALGELHRQGIVVRRYRQVLVTDMRRLCEFSGFAPENPENP
ncbi:MAG: Crp/Fnr family transcriptional regulator [Pseudonocardiaceae bacterium]